MRRFDALEEMAMEMAPPITMTFFRPTNEFVKWLKEYAGDRIVVDVGCGIGEALYHYRKAGIRACGVEPRFDSMNAFVRMELSSAVQRKPAQTASFLHDGDYARLAVLARPCHGGLTERVAGCIQRKDTELLYISKPRNLEQDVVDADLQYEKLPLKFEVGEEGEKVYRIQIPKYAN
jgi:SAM-dependent methyltransferase